MIRDLFGCEPLDVEQEQVSGVAMAAQTTQELIPDQELLSFLDEREALREQMYEDLSIASYLRSHDKLTRFGLDEYFMEVLKWEINLKMGGEPDTFFSNEFELRFKSQEFMLELVKSLQDQN